MQEQTATQKKAKEEAKENKQATQKEFGKKTH